MGLAGMKRSSIVIAGPSVDNTSLLENTSAIHGLFNNDINTITRMQLNRTMLRERKWLFKSTARPPDKIRNTTRLTPKKDAKCFDLPGDSSGRAGPAHADDDAQDDIRGARLLQGVSEVRERREDGSESEESLHDDDWHQWYESHANQYK